MKKRYIVIISVIILLVILRLALSTIVTRYVNNVLNNIENHYGKVDNVHLALYRGAYQIEGLELYALNGNDTLPFVDIPNIQLAVEWSAIFKGEIVGEIIFEQPTINFIAGSEEEDGQTGESVDWTEPIKELMPLQINKLEVRNGNIVFLDFMASPAVDLSLTSLDIIATNLNNADHNDEKLPSNIDISGIAFGGGELNIDMKMNILKQIPDMDMDLHLENVDMTALNDFFKAYAKFDVEQGNFNVYSELIIDEGAISGYVRPIAENIKVIDWEENKKKPLKLAWEAVVGGFVSLFKNHKEDRFATEVPLSGSIENVDAKIWPTIWNIFKNAFVQALEKGTSGEDIQKGQRSAQE